MVGELPRYRASGRTSMRFLPAAAGAVAVAIALGWAYQALTGGGYVFLNLICYLVFAIGVAAAVVAAGRLGKNRNRTLGAVVGLAIAGAALVAAYDFDYRGVADEVAAEARRQGMSAQAAQDARARFTFAAFIDRRVEAGWALGKRAPGQAGKLTGRWVWLMWTLEALGVLGIATGFGVAFGPFCEHCRRWMVVEALPVRAGLDAAALDAVASATTIDALFPPPPATGAPPGRFALSYSVHRCKTCAADGYVTVTKRSVVQVQRTSTLKVSKVKTETLQVQVAVPSARLRALQASSS